jgi:hypothetical protein
MLKILCLSLVLCSAQFLFGQTKEIFLDPNFQSLAKDHKILAILPFKATISLRPKQMEKMSAEEFRKLQVDQGLAVQGALQTYFLKQKSNKNISVDFQELGKTNALLEKSGIDEENIGKFTPEELSQLLEVDGVIGGTISTSKPMSDGASLAMGLLVGFYGSTNSGKCSISITDGKTGKLLWKYDKTLSRSLGSDLNTIINAMMRKASRKFPYNNIKK